MGWCDSVCPHQAFPTGPTVATSGEKRKRNIDAAIMGTIIYDLQPFTQVKRYVWSPVICHLSPATRLGFQMLLTTLDPTFSVSSDFYYRGLLAKVLHKYLSLIHI